MWLWSEIKTLGDIPRHYARTLPDKPALIDATGPEILFYSSPAAVMRLAK